MTRTKLYQYREKKNCNKKKRDKKPETLLWRETNAVFCCPKKTTRLSDVSLALGLLYFIMLGIDGLLHMHVSGLHEKLQNTLVHIVVWRQIYLRVIGSKPFG